MQQAPVCRTEPMADPHQHFYNLQAQFEMTLFITIAAFLAEDFRVLLVSLATISNARKLQHRKNYILPNPVSSNC